MDTTRVTVAFHALGEPVEIELPDPADVVLPDTGETETEQAADGEPPVPR